MKPPSTPPARAGVPDRAEPPVPARDAVRSMYEAHAGFVYQSLVRLGVREADLPDVTHEVFLVAFRRAEDREGRSSDRTWLFGIAFKLAAGYRRRAFRKREKLVDDAESGRPGGIGGFGDLPLGSPTPASPEVHAARNEARVAAKAILDDLPLEERIAFVMFEVDAVPCPEIAEELGWPLGTVYTRVRNARRRFEAAVRRHRAKEDHRVERGALAMVVGAEGSKEPIRLLDDPSAPPEVTSALSRLPTSPVLPAATKAAIGAKLAPSLAAAGTIAGGTGLAGFVTAVLPSGGAALVTLAVAGAVALAAFAAVQGTTVRVEGLDGGNRASTLASAPASSPTQRTAVAVEKPSPARVHHDDEPRAAPAPSLSARDVTGVPVQEAPGNPAPHVGAKGTPQDGRAEPRPADPPLVGTASATTMSERPANEQRAPDAPEGSAADAATGDPSLHGPPAEASGSWERDDEAASMPDADALSAEQAILAAARAAAADDPRRSLALLETHAERFPAGQMASDRDLLTIVVFGRLGRAAAQQTAIRAFLDRYPSSPLAPTLRRQLPAREP